MVFGTSATFGAGPSIVVDENNGLVQAYQISTTTTVEFAHMERATKIIVILYSTGGTILWPARVQWPGAAPTLTGSDVFLFTSPDGGTTIHGRVIQHL
jgi:hypothetical protein